MRLSVIVTFTAVALVSACGTTAGPQSSPHADEAGAVSEASEDAGEGLFEDAPMIDTSSTELPPEWPDSIPVLDGSVIDNVLTMDGSITAVWVIPRGDSFSILEEFVTGLEQAGFTEGEAETSESFARGAYSDKTNTVTFDIMPLTETDWQLYVTYAPRDVGS